MNKYKDTPFDMTGRLAFVAGAAGILGREFTFALASAGANLFLADQSKAGLVPLQQELREKFPGAEVRTCEVDVRDKKSVQSAAKQCHQEFQRIDVLVNSAAKDAKFDKDADVSRFSRFTDFPLELWQESLSVNLTGAFLLAQAVAGYMEAQGEGSMIFIGSHYGMVGPDQKIYRKNGQEDQAFKPADYPTVKAGLLGLTKYLAAYYAGTKIRVNMLTPAGVRQGHDQEFQENYAANTLLGRMSEKEEFRSGILFLASAASSYMTGSNLVMDGGWTAV